MVNRSLADVSSTHVLMFLLFVPVGGRAVIAILGMTSFFGD